MDDQQQQRGDSGSAFLGARVGGKSGAECGDAKMSTSSSSSSSSSDSRAGSHRRRDRRPHSRQRPAARELPGVTGGSGAAAAAEPTRVPAPEDSAAAEMAPPPGPLADSDA